MLHKAQEHKTSPRKTQRLPRKHNISRVDNQKFSRESRYEFINQPRDHSDRLLYTIDIELLNNFVIVLPVQSSFKIGSIADKIREHQASRVLNWPHTKRGTISSKRTFSDWICPAALRLSHRAVQLDSNKTLRDLGLGPYSHLRAHMYFSFASQSIDHLKTNMTSISTPATKDIRCLDSTKMNCPGTKRSGCHEHEHSERETCTAIKRRKFNEPLRNNHFHDLLNVQEKLEVSSKNAARYGLDVDDLEDLLNNLDLAEEEL